MVIVTCEFGGTQEERLLADEREGFGSSWSRAMAQSLD